MKTRARRFLLRADTVALEAESELLLLLAATTTIPLLLLLLCFLLSTRAQARE